MKSVLKAKGYNTAVGDERALHLTLPPTEALQVIIEAIKKAGYEPGEGYMHSNGCCCMELYKGKVSS